jgi:predicted HNH restriction endonuclease
MHITVGTSDDLDYLRKWIVEHDSVTSPVPMRAKIGDLVLFLYPAFTGEIVASGTVQSVPTSSERWSQKYEAKISSVRMRGNPIPIALLEQRLPEWKYLEYARSYVTVPEPYVVLLEDLLCIDRRFDTETGVSADEVASSETYSEGAIRQVIVNAYERDPALRRKCIEAHGAICSVCRFNFREVYGDVAQDYIHVHHLRPLSEIREEHQVDPVNDLRPVCPNCHAVIHRRTPPYTIEEALAFLGGRIVKAVAP